MPHCRNCGGLLNGTEINCPSCGVLVPQKDSSEMQQEAVRLNQVYTTEQPKPAYTATHAYGKPAQAENGPTFLWGLLGFFVPLAGLILFLVWKDTKPKSAKAAGIGALVSVILGVVLYILAIVAAGCLFVGVQNGLSGMQYMG